MSGYTTSFLLPSRACSTFQDLSLSLSLFLPFSQYLTRMLSARRKLASLLSQMYGTSLSSTFGIGIDRSRFASYIYNFVSLSLSLPLSVDQNDRDGRYSKSNKHLRKMHSLFFYTSFRVSYIKRDN